MQPFRRTHTALTSIYIGMKRNVKFGMENNTAAVEEVKKKPDRFRIFGCETKNLSRLFLFAAMRLRFSSFVFQTVENNRTVFFLPPHSYISNELLSGEVK